ncbi:uncharacterized protein [Physcomitrium patens]|uniref:Uncharacterized protein n=1 Tax=Physcomitrium patens TaxID=3218 RepID=A9T348_PHYPA|nr:uncharacterized protein LOC112290676 [Physcomitrium patens]XP_024393001.1 uncharacterized protein LOC112290676 [Physcomitrium patens]PNR42521.1 hypothetical protein PHYPA_017351 [Physcomitrium patens]|eukprot:XP_024392999.1 uncharacterized protein LOC112290676 [Physcomitrella patens]
MASFLLSEVYIVERTIASGHAELDDLTCEATVCTSEHQAYCEAIKNMIRFALDKNCDSEEEESLRYEMTKTMRRRGISVERRYKRLKDLIIGASRAFNAEKTYYTVKRSAIVAQEKVDEEAMIIDALKQLGAMDEKAEEPPKRASRNATQAPRDPSLKGRGRVLPPLLAHEQGLARKRARDHDSRLHHNIF